MTYLALEELERLLIDFMRDGHAWDTEDEECRNVLAAVRREISEAE